MEALTRALAVELAPIRVNACPGAISKSDRAAMYRDIGQKLPVGRVGEADDLAQAYLYLMQESYGAGPGDRCRWRRRAGLDAEVDHARETPGRSQDEPFRPITPPSPSASPSTCNSLSRPADKV